VARIDAVAHLELRAPRVGQAGAQDRQAPGLERMLDRRAVPERRVQALGELQGRAIADRAVDADRAIDVLEQQRRERLGVARGQHHQLHRRAGEREDLLHERVRHHAHGAIPGVEHQPAPALDPGARPDSSPGPGIDEHVAIRRHRRTRAAAGLARVAAEMDDRRRRLAQLADEVIRLARPASDEIEAAVPGAPELLLDRAHLLIQPEAHRPGRIRAEVERLAPHGQPPQAPQRDIVLPGFSRHLRLCSEYSPPWDECSPKLAQLSLWPYSITHLNSP
jgi:hypothetical protein